MWKWWKEMKRRSPWRAPVCLTRCNQEILESCSFSQVFPKSQFPTRFCHKEPLEAPCEDSAQISTLIVPHFLCRFKTTQMKQSYMSWSPNPPDPTCANRACTLIRNPGISARLIPGPPGCGKSTMASLISKRENRVFYEGKLFRQEFIAGPKVWKLRFSRWWFPPGI